MAEDYSNSAMIALVPSAADAQRLAVDGYETVEDLHVTLAFLGDVSNIDDPAPLEAGLRRIAATIPPLELKTWAVSHFNPTEKACAVYLVGQGKDETGPLLDRIHEQAVSLALNEMGEKFPEQHSPWVPHLTIGYDLDPDMLTEAGNPLTFDRLRLAMGTENIDIPLEAADPPLTASLLAQELDERLRVLEAVVAAPRARNLIRRAAREFNELLHPRGKDGRFIEKHGFVKGEVTVPGDGSKVSATRAKVRNILPNPSNANDPIVEVELEDGRVGRALSSTITTTAGPKARLNAPRMDEGRTLPLESPDPGPDLGFDAEPGDRGVMTPEQVKNLNRDQLRTYINNVAKELSTDDAEARAAGLDALLAGVFRSQLDTDFTHNQLGEDKDQWTPERVALHEGIWSDLISKIEASGVPKERDAFALGGLPGAGKSSSLRPGGPASEMGVVAWDPGETPDPPEGVTHVSINPDSIKEMLIDAGGLPPGIEGLKPMEQVTFIHEESSALSKIFLNRLAEEGYNVVLDNTMETPAGMKKRMIPLASAGYSFRGLFVDISPEESKVSAKARYARLFQTDRGGRFVPSAVVGEKRSTRGRMSANRDAFDELAGIDENDNVTGTGWFREFLVVDNTGVSKQNPRSQVTLRGQGDGSPARAFAPAPQPEMSSQQELLERMGDEA